MPKPNFFIVGAAKSGTTSLYEYLRQHPDIFMPEEKYKEPHFFGKDLQAPWFIRDEKEYLKLFDGAGNKRLVGEASAYYIYSKTAAKEIKAFSPQARIIILLRQPVDMMYSLHGHLLYHGREDITDFLQALDAEKDRKAGKRIPKTDLLRESLYYHDIASYSEQVRRYIDTFGKERVKIILFDDFVSHTADVYKDVLRFLGTSDTFIPVFETANQNRTAHRPWLKRMLQHPSGPIATIRDHLPSSIRHKASTTLGSLHTIEGGRPPLDKDVRKKLTKDFTSDIDRLSTLIDRDLSMWK